MADFIGKYGTVQGSLDELIKAVGIWLDKIRVTGTSGYCVARFTPGRSWSGSRENRKGMTMRKTMTLNQPLQRTHVAAHVHATIWDCRDITCEGGEPWGRVR